MRWLFAIGSLLTLCAVSATASAQTAADQIRGLVKDGQKVAITDDQGRDLKGRIFSITTHSLTIAHGRERTDVPYEEIVKIDHEDPLKNGALIGFAVGGLLGVLMVIPSDCQPGQFFCGDPNAGNYIATGLFVGGLGAALGTGIDALIGGDRNIYRRGSSISASPLLGRGRAGAVVAIAW